MGKEENEEEQKIPLEETMIIVIERPFSDFVEYSAIKGNVAFSSGDVKIHVFEDEKEFREKFPEAPKEWDEINAIYWEKRKWNHF